MQDKLRRIERLLIEYFDEMKELEESQHPTFAARQETERQATHEYAVKIAEIQDGTD